MNYEPRGPSKFSDSLLIVLNFNRNDNWNKLDEL